MHSETPERASGRASLELWSGLVLPFNGFERKLVLILEARWIPATGNSTNFPVPFLNYPRRFIRWMIAIFIERFDRFGAHLSGCPLDFIRLHPNPTVLGKREFLVALES